MQGPRVPSTRERLAEIREGVASGRYKFNAETQEAMQFLLKTLKICEDNFRRIGTRWFNGTPNDAIELVWMLSGEDLRPQADRMRVRATGKEIPTGTFTTEDLYALGKQ